MTIKETSYNIIMYDVLYCTLYDELCWTLYCYVSRTVQNSNMSKPIRALYDRKFSLQYGTVCTVNITPRNQSETAGVLMPFQQTDDGHGLQQADDDGLQQADDG
jgi:hypothetical protein